MDSIKIYDLENQKNVRSCKLTSDLRITISPDKVSGNIGSRLLTFNAGNEEIRNGYTRLNFAENTLTGDVYIILSKTKGIELRKRQGAQGHVCTKNTIVDLLCTLLKLEVKQIRVNLTFSNNLSKDDSQITYCIVKKEIL